MCNRNAVILGEKGSRRRRGVIHNAQTDYPGVWVCPKYNDTISWRACRKRERETHTADHGGIDCWECKNLLKQRRAEYAHNRSKKLTPAGLAIIVFILALIAFWAWVLGTAAGLFN